MVDPDYHKRYYREHREQFKEYHNKKMKCPICLTTYKCTSLQNHYKTEKHLKAIKTKDEFNELLKKYNELKPKIKTKLK